MTSEKKKLRIIYQLEKKRIGLDRKKLENYIVGFKFDTPEEREQFKEFVKECYYKDDCCENKEPAKEPTGEAPKKKPGRPKKVTGKDV